MIVNHESLFNVWSLRATFLGTFKTKTLLFILIKTKTYMIAHLLILFYSIHPYFQIIPLTDCKQNHFENLKENYKRF